MSALPIEADPIFLALNRAATRPYRNAELVVIGTGITSVVRACEFYKCGPHSILYEVDGHNGAEWVDSSRDVVATYRGEVFLASHYSLAKALHLTLLAERPADGAKRVYENPSNAPCNNFPAVYLNPARWSSIYPPIAKAKRRQRVEEGGEGVDCDDGENEGEEEEEDEEEEAAALDIRVFASFHPKNIGNRRIRVGQRCLVMRHDATLLLPDDDDYDDRTNDRHMAPMNSAAATNVNGTSAANSAAANMPSTKQSGENNNTNNSGREKKTKKKNGGSEALNESVLALGKSHSQAIPDELFLDHYKQHVTTHEPLGGAPTVFVGRVVWNRIDAHVYATTVVSSSSAAVMNPTSPVSQQQKQQTKNTLPLLLRSSPKRRVLVLCCFGMPEEVVLCAVLQPQLAGAQSGAGRDMPSGKQQRSAATTREEEISVVLFLELPTLHYDSASISDIACNTGDGGAVFSTGKRDRKKTATTIRTTTITTRGQQPRTNVSGVSHMNPQQPQSLLLRARQQRPQRSHVKLAQLHAMLLRVLEASSLSSSSSSGLRLKEIDVVINCASRYVSAACSSSSSSSSHQHSNRMPSSNLWRLYVDEMRGGEEALESASSVVCINRDRIAPLMAELFAQRIKIPFVRLEQHLGVEVFSTLPARGGEDDGNLTDDADDDDAASNNEELLFDDHTDDRNSGDEDEFLSQTGRSVYDDDDDDDDDDPFKM